jgi:hypothetical protein
MKDENKPKTKKVIIIIVVIIIAGVVAFYFFNKSNTPTSDSSLRPQMSTDLATSNDAELSKDTSFISTLLSLNKITIDSGIFSSISFKGLHDNTVDIKPSDSIGRPNPFAPFDTTIPSDNSNTLPTISNNGTIKTNNKTSL